MVEKSKKSNKVFISNILFLVLTVISEIVCLYLLKVKLGQEQYKSIDVEFNKILIGEIIIAIIINILYLINTYLKTKKKINIKPFYISESIILMVIVFILISFRVYSFGNFVNIIMFYIFSTLLENNKIIK